MYECRERLTVGLCLRWSMFCYLWFSEFDLALLKAYYSLANSANYVQFYKQPLTLMFLISNNIRFVFYKVLKEYYSQILSILFPIRINYLFTA